jgi:hypothetical protein
MMQSRARLPLSAIEPTSSELDAAVKQRLAWFCGHQAEHARFLNTLSLLEHIGSRKIMNSRAGGGLSGEVLRHLAEETRHAFFFKHGAERLARSPLGYGAAETIAGSAARSYMGRLDGSIKRECGAVQSPLPYLYMSLIVELRAVWFYGLYQDVLAEQKVSVSLKSLLAEEELHLDAMLARLADMDPKCTVRVAQFRTLEQQRFLALWSAIEDECSAVRLAAE